jgi:hypothetical protein
MNINLFHQLYEESKKSKSQDHPNVVAFGIKFIENAYKKTVFCCSFPTLLVWNISIICVPFTAAE